MRNPGKGRLLTFEPSSGNWRKNLGTDIRNGSVKRYPIIGIPFGLRPHSIPIMGNDTVNGILPASLREKPLPLRDSARNLPLRHGEKPHLATLRDVALSALTFLHSLTHTGLHPVLLDFAPSALFFTIEIKLCRALNK